MRKTKHMDIRHYFDPVDFSNFQHSAILNRKHTLGASIEKTMNSLVPKKTEQIDVAILGIPYDSRIDGNLSEVPDKIRKELYQLTKINQQITIADFGNLKLSATAKGTYRAVRDVIEYFNELKIVTIILGGSQDLTVGVCDAFKNNPFFSLTVIDALLDVKTGNDPLTPKNYLSHIFKLNPEIFQFNLIGYQSYFTAHQYFTKTKGVSQHLRLGLLRDKIAAAEPVFRNSDVVSFDIGAVKYADAPGDNIVSPNGLRSEEACQLSRYAGIASRVKVFGLFEISHNDAAYPTTIKLASQIIWHFLEGFANRLPGNVNAGENNTVYKVEVKDIDHPLVFIKDLQTERWWMEIKTVHSETHYFACSEEEYLQASNNEIPELWLKYVQKSDEILK